MNNKKHKKNLMIATAIASIAVPSSTVISCAIGNKIPSNTEEEDGDNSPDTITVPWDTLTNAIPINVPIDDVVYPILTSENYKQDTEWDNSIDPVTNQPKGKLIIREGVTQISENVFVNGYPDPDPDHQGQFLPIKILTLPTSLISIDDSAFESVELRSLKIPHKVTSIGNRAFQKSRLESLIIPNSLRSIGNSAFGASPLTHLILPKSITNTNISNIGDSAFGSIENKSSTIVAMNEELFNNADIKNRLFGEGNWDQIRLFDGILNLSNYKYFTEWNNALFKGKLTIIDAVTEITDVFKDGYIIDPSRPSQVKTIKRLEIPNSVKTIAKDAFLNSPLTSLTFGDSSSLLHIGDDAFAHSQLKSLELPDNLQTIGVDAFSSSPLTSLTIPNSVTDIGEQAFLHIINTSTTHVSMPFRLNTDVIRNKIFGHNNWNSIKFNLT